MVRDTWSGLHGQGYMVRVTWSGLHGQGYMVRVTWSGAPDVIRMPVHYAGSMSHCNQSPRARLGLTGLTKILSLWVWAPGSHLNPC